VIAPETEEDWIAAARGKTCQEVAEMGRGHKKGDGPDDPEDPDLRLRRLVVELPPQTLAMYRELRVELEAEMGHRVEEAEVFRIMVERARVSPEGASTPAQISICSHCERGWQSGVGGRAELEPEEIERVRCEAEQLGSVEGELGRKVVTLSARRRARIFARDRHRCAVPGCRNKRHLDVHHIEHQEDGGGHEDWNLITLCSGHHRMHHRGRLAIEGRAPEGVRFVFVRDDDAHVGTKERHAHVGTNERQADSAADSVVMRAQARDALVGLGWKGAIARAAVEEACAHVDGGAPIDVVIREALRRCPRPTG